MKINNIAFVGIPVTDVRRVRKFYEAVFGLHVAQEMMSGKWVEYAIGNQTLAIANAGEQWTPSDQGITAALELKNFDEVINQLRTQSVPFVAEPFELRVVTWP